MIIFNSGNYSLFSYEYIKICPYVLISVHLFPKIMTSLEKRTDLFDKDITLLMDNGAFSQWNNGDEVISNKNWIEFCGAFYEKYRKHFKEIYFISLDKIPGSVGVMPTLAQIQESAEITYQNFQEALQSNIKTALPVFHQHEEIKFLKNFVKLTDFICISPANDQTNKSREKWLDNTFKITGKIKTHGLAVTGQYLLQKFPFYSADSTSWLIPHRFATMNIFPFNKYELIRLKDNDLEDINVEILKYQNIFSMDQEVLNINSEIIKYSLHNVKRLEDFITDLWKERGYEWN